jgi:uncharacterized membrane protein YccC
VVTTAATGGASSAGAGIRAAIDALADRPAAPTRHARAALYLTNDVERLEDLVGALEASPPAPTSPDAGAVLASANTLARIGRGLAGEDVAVPAPSSPADGAPVPAPFGTVGRLSTVTGAVEQHAGAALGSTEPGRVGEAFTDLQRGGAWADVRHGARRIAANMTARSVHLQDALRLGAGLALATAAVKAFSLQHGFWVAFATLTILKSNVRATGRSVGQATAGTAVGFGAATIIIALVGTNTKAYLVLLPIVVTAAIYANVAVSFFVGQAGFTVTIIVLFNLLGPAGWRIGIVRIEDVVAGGLVGLAVGALVWPRGASATMRPAVAGLLERASAYLVATLHEAAATGPLGADGPDGGSRAASAAGRPGAVASAVRAESSFAQYLAEHPPPDAASRWAALLRAGNGLWYAADLLRARAEVIARRDRPELDAAARRLADHYATAVAGLRSGHLPDDDRGHRPGAGAGDDLLDWLADLTGGAPSGVPRGAELARS